MKCWCSFVIIGWRWFGILIFSCFFNFFSGFISNFICVVGLLCFVLFVNCVLMLMFVVRLFWCIVVDLCSVWIMMFRLEGVGIGICI